MSLKIIPGIFSFIILISCSMLTVREGDSGEAVLSEEEKIKNHIEILVDALALPDNSRITKICDKLISYKEDAIPELSKNIDNRIAIVRSSSIHCLGQIYKEYKIRRVLRYKNQIKKRLSDPLPRVRLQAAAALSYMNDYTGIPLLIEALLDESKYVRMVASQVLFDNFNKTFGYQYYDKEEKRFQAAKKWAQWWEART